MPLGFIKIPRSLEIDPLWTELSLTTQHVFRTILSHASFKKVKYNVFGTLIDIEPGELCISYEDLAELCRKRANMSEKEMNKQISVRSVKKLIQCHFLIQKVNQKMKRKRTILCISRLDVYNNCFSQFDTESDTENETQVIQKRYRSDTQRKKERKKEVKKEEKVKKENSEISKEEEPKEQTILIREFLQLTPADLEKLKNIHLPEKLEWLFNRLDSWMTTKEGPFTPKWCYGQLKPGGWPCLEYEKMKKDEIKTATFSVNQKQIPAWQKQQEDARLYAQKVSKEYSSKYCDIEVTQNAIFFHPRGGADTNPTEVKFKENGFVDQVDSMLRKKGFLIKIQPIALAQGEI